MGEVHFDTGGSNGNPRESGTGGGQRDTEIGRRREKELPQKEKRFRE